MSRYFLLAALACNLAAVDRNLTSPSPPFEFYFSVDGKTIVARCRDNQVRTWDLASGKLLSEKTYGMQTALLTADLLIDGDPKSKTMKVWDLTANRQLQLLNGAPERTVAVSKNRNFLATSNAGERSIRVWNLATGKQQHELLDGLGGASELVFSPDGATVVSANYDNDIRVWKTKSGELIRKVEDMTGAMFAAEFTPDGKQLIMAGLDETVYIWDARTFALSRKLRGHGETISSLSISPDGRTLVTGGFDVITQRNPVKLAIWDLAAGKITKSISAAHRVVAIAFSPDGKWIAFSTGENEISLLSLIAAAH